MVIFVLDFFLEKIEEKCSRGCQIGATAGVEDDF